MLNIEKLENLKNINFSNKDFLQFLQKESILIYKVFQFLAEGKKQVAIDLFLFWRDIHPLNIIKNSDYTFTEQNLENIKQALIFNQENPFNYNLIKNLNRLKERINWKDSVFYEFFIKIFNGLEVCLSNNVYINKYSDLEFILSAIGGNISCFSFFFLFPEVFKFCDFNLINKFGTDCFYWELLKNNNTLIQHNKLFICFDDLDYFHCKKEDFLENNNNENIIKLTKFQLQKLKESFLYIMNNSKDHPLEIKIILDTIIKNNIKEIDFALKNNWSLSLDFVDLKKSPSIPIIKNFFKRK